MSKTFCQHPHIQSHSARIRDTHSEKPENEFAFPRALDAHYSYYVFIQRRLNERNIRNIETMAHFTQM